MTWNIIDDERKFVPGGFVQVFLKGTEPWTVKNGWAAAKSDPVHICGNKNEWKSGATCPTAGELSLPQLPGGEYAGTFFLNGETLSSLSRIHVITRSYDLTRRPPLTV